MDAQPNRFIWHLDVPVTAEYKVYARWTATPDRDRNATYVIAHDGGESPVTVNQQLKGARWNLLGTYSFTRGAPNHISITDQERRRRGGRQYTADAGDPRVGDRWETR